MAEPLNACSEFFHVHDLQIKQSSDKLEEHDNILRGLPQHMDNIERRMDEMCALLQKNEDKYMTKDGYDRGKEQLETLIAIIDKKVDSTNKLVMTVILSGAGLFISAFVGLTIFMMQSRLHP